MKHWEKVALSPEATIRETLRVIDEHQSQFALVVDADRRLLGTVTDGDVRRGLLKGVGMDDAVREVCKTGCIVGSPDESPAALHRRMVEAQVRQLPLVDADGRVVGLELLKDLEAAPRRENMVVVMAGGLGTRLRPLTESCPKPMIRVGGRPVLETILVSFRDQGFHRFCIAVNYKAGMIEDYFGTGDGLDVDIQYLREDKRLGTAGALGLLPERPDAPFVLMNGDVLTTMDFGAFLDFHVVKGRSATMCVRGYEYQVPYGVADVRDDELVGVVEKPVCTHLVNAGIYALEPEVLDYVARGEHHDMTDVIPRLLEAGRGVSAYHVKDYWLDIGRMGDLERAECEFGEWFA